MIFKNKKFKFFELFLFYLNIYYFFNKTNYMKFIQNLLLYISAFIPMYFLILVNILLDILNDNLTFNVLNTTMIITLSFLILLGSFEVIWAIKFNKDKNIKIILLEKKNTTDQHFLGYFSLFVLFALSFELEKVSEACVFAIILILVGIVYINNKLFYINPFLNILGYNFYDIRYKLVNSGEERRAKIFYHGNLNLSQEYEINLKNENFSFLTSIKKQ